MRRLLYILSFCLLAVSCVKEDLQKAIVSQEEAIDQYITSNFADFEIKRSNGANRVILVKGDPSKVVEPGDSVTFSYVGYIFDNGQTNAFAQGDRVAAVGRGELVRGLDSGISGMALGEEANILFSCKYGFKSNVGMVNSTNALMYNIIVKKIKKK